MKTDWEEQYYAIAALHNADEAALVGRKAERMIAYIRERMPRELLEVGCGEAKLVDRLPQGVAYTGIDPSTYAIDRARAAYVKTPAFFDVGHAHALPYADNAFDMVVAHYSLEHFAKPRESLLEMMRVLKPNGALVLIAPNLEFPFSYPTAFRHKPKSHRLRMALVRSFDYVLRLFGVYTFRTVPENYLDATGTYERGDDDLRYLVSTYEVVNFLKRRGLMPAYVARLAQGPKTFLTHFPGLRYYGTELFGIFLKQPL